MTAPFPEPRNNEAFEEPQRLENTVHRAFIIAWETWNHVGHSPSSCGTHPLCPESLMSCRHFSLLCIVHKTAALSDRLAAHCSYPMILGGKCFYLTGRKFLIRVSQYRVPVGTVARTRGQNPKQMPLLWGLRAADGLGTAPSDTVSLFRFLLIVSDNMTCIRRSVQTRPRLCLSCPLFHSLVPFPQKF